MTRRNRIEALEAAHWRQMVAELCTDTPVNPDALLDEALRVFSMPRAQQRAKYPGYSDAEWDEAQSWLPAIRRARYGSGRPRDWHKEA
jgi:hypothetical protein